MNDVELRDVVGYEGYYKVSNHGDVFSVTKWVGHYTRKCKKLSPFLTRGYLRVILSKDGKSKKHLVHRLVAEAFITNPESKPHVNHKNSDRSCNSVDNLEWVYPQDNVEHAIRQGGLDPHKKRISFEKRLEIFEHFLPFDSERGTIPTGEKFGVGKQTVSNIRDEILHVVETLSTRGVIVNGKLLKLQEE